MKNQSEWDKTFSENHLNSWGSVSSIVISKIKPNGTNARSIYNEDKEMILKAAKKYGYEKTWESNTVVNFLNRNLKSGDYPN